MSKRSVVKKWLLYVSIIVLGALVGGDFGMAAGLLLIFMLHGVTTE